MAKKAKRPARVCFKIRKARGGWRVQLYSAKGGRFRDYLGAPCLRQRKASKAQLFLTRAAAVQGAKDCELRKKCPV